MDFHKLYNENVEAVRRTCLSYLKHDEDAADAVQDTFFKASQSLDSFNDNSSVGTWLISIAKNVCSDKLKARKKDQRLYHSKSNGEELWSENYQDVGSPEAILEAEEDGEHMLDIFEQLNDKTKQALKLRFVDELSMKEIAQAMGVPVGTAKTWVHRGRSQILSTISPQ